ncbi:hypothetical protein RclHR1_04290001 [Rhizophagus clarus]|uniref:Helitron helicase-like domain-containing protein n=1 Tax=Rhizophagus clarus TaxID=94130 RepID=A0A2Z6RTR1_9GLOM|nr:hypothetical protein RclHR1_04290001 [Rhizophagus clarus]
MNIISPLSPAPQYLHSLLTTNDPITNEPYVNQIRAYNQVLAFTSLGANIDENLANAKDGIYTFRIQGAFIFRANEIEPESDLMEIDENETAQITENESENGSDNEVYRLQVRNLNKITSILHLSGRLFQQYLVDQYAKWESNNLRWYRENQKHLRTEIYSGLQDIISEEDINTGNIGKKVILSSSFTGSVRYSMAIVREFGKHDLFITFTCNLKWPEITNELLPNQQASDCPDLVSNDIVICHHCNLMILASENKPKTPEDFDKLVCAEIPDRNLQPLLFETVNKNMVHGSCGVLNSQSPCMINGKCSKNYHHEFVLTTSINKYGYPLYRRRNNGHTITKGYDRVIVSIKNSNDEIEKYLNARYDSASEACWRLFNFGLQERSHKVERLPVYLPNQQSVIFQKNENVHIILEKSSHTKLTCYFE